MSREVGIYMKSSESVRMAVKHCDTCETVRNNAKLDRASIGGSGCHRSVHVGYQTDGKRYTSV
jgi:hypothetical protein